MTAIRLAHPGSPLALVLLLFGCSRTLPDPPLESPIASESASAQPIAVDVALRSDPPLPADSRAGWPGLVEPEPAGHSHHHHGAAKPEPTKDDEHEH